MEWFFQNDTQLNIFLVACVAGLLAKSYRDGIALVGVLVGAILVIAYSVIAYNSHSLSVWLGGCIYAFIGKSAGEFLVLLARIVFGDRIWFARIFPSRRAFMLDRSQMQIHEVDCHGYKICILRPGETAPDDYYDNLEILSDFAEAESKAKDKTKYEVDLLQYRLRAVGGRDPSETLALIVSYQLSFLQGDNLLDVENAKKRVADYACRNIFTSSATTGDGEYKLKLTNLQIHAGDWPYIRYSAGTSDLRYGEYLHLPINSEFMLTLYIQTYAERVEAVAASKDVVEFLLNACHIAPLDAEGSALPAWVGWQSQVWAEVEPPPLLPKEFLTQDKFGQFLETHAEDPLLWDVFQRSTNYKGWLNFQYAAHLDKYNAGYPRIFQEKMARYTIAEKQDKPEVVCE